MVSEAAAVAPAVMLNSRTVHFSTSGVSKPTVFIPYHETMTQVYSKQIEMQTVSIKSSKELFKLTEFCPPK